MITAIALSGVFLNFFLIERPMAEIVDHFRLDDVVKSPAYSTGVGLVKYGASRLKQAPAMMTERVPMKIAAEATNGWGGRLGQWFREVF